MTLKIGVGEMVSFLYASGDLSSETFQNVSQLEGIKAHQYVQNKYDSKGQKEVSIKGNYDLNDKTYQIQGRMDGLLEIDGEIHIEEIKSTRRDIHDFLFTPNLEHEAQLKIYAFLWMYLENIGTVKGRLTYIELSKYQTKTFDYVFTRAELKPFFETSIETYGAWITELELHLIEKKASLQALKFPFETYRKGQRDLMKATYHTMKEDEVLFAIAPTGIGKTMATLFSTLKALDDDQEKIFYCTAKNQGKKVAIDSMDTLHTQGLKTKTIEITSKDDICFLEKRECDPDKCPFARGFFDRLTDAMKDMFLNESLMTRAVVESYARKHTVCPFEFSLFISYYVDVIICDYNYVFDPRIHLVRYFDDDTYKPKLLIDEAHNMVPRSRDMFSATLLKSDLITLRKAGSKLKPSIRHSVNKLIERFDHFEAELEGENFKSYLNVDMTYLELVSNLMMKITNALKENPKYPKKSEVMDGYMKLLTLSVISLYYDTPFRFNIIRQTEDLEITIQCLDASKYIQDTLKNKSHGAVFFSATLYPTDYYQTLISKGYGQIIQITSPFDRENLKIMTNDRVDTRYKSRDQSLEQITKAIETVVKSKVGNYIAFFPSYQYLNQVKDALDANLDIDIIVQSRAMEAYQREEIMSLFKRDLSRSQIAFFVMGGVFAEGIDYVGDMLSGVIIVGVGLPMVNEPNQQLRAYYDDTFKRGFDYAYTYPGMNKVIQAVGRVIRKDDDYGVALLMDDRFVTPLYKRLMPKEWDAKQVVRTESHLEDTLKTFWEKMAAKYPKS
ncbi:hypothetical protein N7603_04670 [Acholeplasma vituli]|uniref:Helicase ATP-binding domain-containing protein n=1 Tax=Paracholeplasma vituli TaxID=69473 RepID=A0ABT2PVS8_9MOLU|nr:helicase C-terminal domain-containing protein [Paracholeplasma vituli]MCU0104945.1 hypothetical protein [Paracholeplasma vituli]